MDFREYNALKYQWASVKALTLNLQANTDGVPFTPEDLLYGGREERMNAVKAEQQIAEMRAQIENFQLGQLKVSGGMDTSGVPAAFLAMGKRHKERNGR